MRRVKWMKAFSTLFTLVKIPLSPPNCERGLIWSGHDKVMKLARATMI